MRDARCAMRDAPEMRNANCEEEPFRISHFAVVVSSPLRPLVAVLAHRLPGIPLLIGPAGDDGIQLVAVPLGRFVLRLRRLALRRVSIRSLRHDSLQSWVVREAPNAPHPSPSCRMRASRTAVALPQRRDEVAA